MLSAITEPTQKSWKVRGSKPINLLITHNHTGLSQNLSICDSPIYGADNLLCDFPKPFISLTVVCAELWVSSALSLKTVHRTVFTSLRSAQSPSNPVNRMGLNQEKVPSWVPFPDGADNRI